jgi:hypothetical protein
MRRTAGAMRAFAGFCSTLSARDHATELIAAEPSHIQKPSTQASRSGSSTEPTIRVQSTTCPNPYVCRK